MYRGEEELTFTPKCSILVSMGADLPGFELLSDRKRSSQGRMCMCAHVYVCSEHMCFVVCRVVCMWYVICGMYSVCGLVYTQVCFGV